MKGSKLLSLILLILLAVFFSLASVSSCFATSLPTLTIVGGSGGTTSPSTGVYPNYASSWTIGSDWDVSPAWSVESTVAVYETPNSGWTFSHWVVNGSSGGSSPSLIFTITGSTTVQPIFVPLVPPPPTTFTLTVLVKNNTVPVIGVTVSIGSSQATTDATGTATFNLASATYLVFINYQGMTQNQTVTLTANQQISFDISSPSPPPSNLQLYTAVIIVVVILVAAIGAVLLRRRK